MVINSSKRSLRKFFHHSSRVQLYTGFGDQRYIPSHESKMFGDSDLRDNFMLRTLWVGWFLCIGGRIIMLVTFKTFKSVTQISKLLVTKIDVTVEKFIEHCFKKFKKPLEPISNSFKSLKDFCHVIKVIFSIQWNALFYVSLWRKLYYCLKLHELV